MFAFVGLVVLIVLIATLLSAIEIVDEDEPKALFVFGEFQTVLEPGLNFIPPFVSYVKPAPTDVETVDVSLKDVETADGTRCSATVRVDVRIVDAETALADVDDYEAALVDVVRSATRDELRGRDEETVRHDTHRVSRSIRDYLVDEVDSWGLAVPAVELEVTAHADGAIST